MIAGMRGGDPAGNVHALAYFVRIDPDDRHRRRLSWTPERSSGVVYHVMMDGVKVVVSDITEAVIRQGNLFPRSVIEVIETSDQNRDELLLNVAVQPDDRVTSSWDAVDGATEYELFRKLAAGSYPTRPLFRAIKGQASYSHIDGPLEDASYVYKLVSYDDDGDSTEDEEPVTIDDARPAAPTNVTGSWNPTTHVLTITWTASVAPDIDHYAIRHNAGTGPIRIDDAPEDTTVLTTWSIDLTGLTGDYEVLIRGVDGDDNEEQNINNIIEFSVILGVAQGIPAAPLQVGAEAIAGGKARISFHYSPSQEGSLSPGGIAKEARVYSDNGTGTMDWVTPVGTVLMDFPVAPTAYTFDTGVLANDTYLFGVRIATDTGGLGVETTNDDTHEVTTNDDVPSATDLVVAIT